MASPFFSGRIPKDLLERVEKHCAETGESKTDVLVYALAAYLDHPVAPRNNSTVEVSKDMFVALEERVATLENLLKQKINNVINPDNTQLNLKETICEQLVISPDNSVQVLEMPEDFWASPIDDTDNNFDNSRGKLSDEQKETVLLLSEHIPKKLENLTSSEIIKQAGLKQSQLDGYKRRVSVKYQKMEQPLVKKQLLNPPEKIETKNPIIINGYPYDLFYLGENEKGSSLWSALPYDNSRYQQLSIHGAFEKILNPSQ